MQTQLSYHMLRLYADIVQAHSAYWRTYCLVLKIANHFFGTDWWEERLGFPSTGSAYFALADQSRSESEQQRRSSLLVARCRTIGEYLYNLQRCDGFEYLHHSLATTPVSDFEARVAEMAVASLFMCQGASVRFRPVSGIKGADYDFDLMGNFQIAVEVKSVWDKTAMLARTVANAVRQAKTQLPADLPGIIVVHFRDTNVDRVTYPDVVDAVNVELLRTGRVSLVILIVEGEPTIETANGEIQPVGVFHGIKVIDNARARIPIPPARKIELLGRETTKSWPAVACKRGVAWTSLHYVANMPTYRLPEWKRRRPRSLRTQGPSAA